MIQSVVLLFLVGWMCNVESTSDVFEVPISSSFGLFYVQYASVISVGTPPKSLSVFIDTRSSGTIIHHKDCTSHDSLGHSCQRDDVYDETKSSTAQKTGDTFDIQYGEGWAKKGIYVKDVFSFGNGSNSKLNTPVKFAVADLILLCADKGTLGLGFPSSNEKGFSITEQLTSQRLLKYPLATIFLKQCPPNVESCEDGGMLTLGKHDRKNCGPFIGTVNVNPQNSQDSPWKFNIDEVSIGNYRHSTRISAVTDTSLPDLHMGPTFLDQLIKETGAVQIYPGGEQYKIDCDKKFAIKFKINGVEYEIPSSELVVKQPNNECQFQIFRKRTDNESWVLGAPFIRSYCQIHDYQNRVIAFAKPGQNQPGNEYTPVQPAANKPVARKQPPKQSQKKRTKKHKKH